MRSSAAQAAIETVLDRLGPDAVPPDVTWEARPLHDGWVVSPVSTRRGGGTWVVLGGAVGHVPSSRRTTEDEVYARLVAERG